MRDNDEPCCYVCHDVIDNETLLCGVCSCRGGSGHCHLSCIVGLGKMKLAEVMKDAQDDNLDAIALRKVWWKCTLCHQFFKRDSMFAKLAEEFMAIASSDYPNHAELKVEALRFKCEAARRSSIDERVPILNDLVAATESIILRKAGVLTPLLRDNAQFARMSLGDIALESGDAAKAMDHYTKCRDLFEGIEGGTWSLKKIDVYIAEATARMPGVDMIAFLQ